MGVQDDAERFQPGSIGDWSSWLAEGYDEVPGVWLVTFKAATGREAFGYEAAVIEALRFGWVDSTQRTLDDERSMMWFSPRRKGSVWTRRNKERIAQLETEGRLEAAGRAAVDAAKDSGMWTLMDDVEDLVVPADLAAALAESPGAAEAFDSFPPSARKQILAWIVTAKRPDTRARRVTEAAVRAARGERAVG